MGSVGSTEITLLEMVADMSGVDWVKLDRFAQYIDEFRFTFHHFDGAEQSVWVKLGMCMTINDERFIESLKPVRHYSNNLQYANLVEETWCR